VTERVPSDHEDVTTHRVSVDRVGRSNRPTVSLPDGLDVAVGEVIRLSLGGQRYYAQVEASIDEAPVLKHAADNRRLARERDGENRLAEWATEVGAIESTVHLDVVTPGYAYGLREPGARVVYTATDRPDDSLADIAWDLDSLD
jgi:hypothetical protein